MKISDYTVSDFNKTIQDESSEYFGGVVAYLSLALNLSLFIKLMKIKKKRAEEDLHTFDVMIGLASSVYQDSVNFAEEDGKIFGLISSKKADDEFIENVLVKQFAYILNLNKLKEYIAALIQTSKGSIVADYKMILESISTTRENVLGIIKYECKKFTDESLKTLYFVKLSAL